MGRPKKSADKTTRARLLQAAEEEFGKRGYSRTRLEDIAAAAGIRRPSLLYYFGSKDQLYREVVLSVTTALRAELAAVLSAPLAASAEGRIEAIATVLLSFARERSAGVSMFVLELLDTPPSGRQNMREFAAIVDLLEETLRSQAGALIPADAPIRMVLVHIITSQALRIASGDLGELLWGPDIDPRLFIRTLLAMR